MTGLVPRRDDLFFPVQQAFDRFFDDFFNSNPLSRVKATSGYPKLNAFQSDGQFVITLAVPGMRSEDLNVEVDSNNLLTVRGRMAEEYQSPENSTFLVKELRQSAFERTIQLPKDLDGDPDASMKDGILRLSWRQKLVPESEGIRRIPVRTD